MTLAHHDTLAGTSPKGVRKAKASLPKPAREGHPWMGVEPELFPAASLDAPIRGTRSLISAEPLGTSGTNHRPAGLPAAIE